MSVLETSQQRQRSKSKKRWPKWLRGPYLLRLAIFIGVYSDRLWRVWRWITGLFDG